MTRPSFDSVGVIQSVSAVSVIAEPKPLGAVAGKAWIIQVWTNANRTFTTPSGFVPIGTNGPFEAAFLRMCDGSEGSTVNVAWTGGNVAAKSISHVWNDVDPTSPILVGGTWASAASAIAVDAPDVTVPFTADNDLLVSLFHGINHSKIVTKPSSMTQAFQNNTTATEAAAFEKAVPGAAGVRTWSWVGVAQSAAMDFVLKGTPIPQSMGILSA